MILADAVAAPGAVAVPAGDPAELRAAASTLSASAEALDGAAATAEAVIGAAVPTAWAGTAARSCGDAQQRAVADCRALVRAMREAAAAVAQLAAELEEAIRDARHVALQAADVAAAMLRIDRMTLEVHAADLSELPAMQARARQLANEEAHLRALGAAAAERARLANLTAAAAFDQVTATLPRIATLGAACPPATRTQLAALLGRPVAATTTPADQDRDSLLGLGAFLAGGVLVDFAKKGKGRTGSRTGAGAVPGGAQAQAGRWTNSGNVGDRSGRPPKRIGRRSTWDSSSCTSDRRARLSTGRVGGTSRAISMGTAAPGRWAISQPS